MKKEWKIKSSFPGTRIIYGDMERYNIKRNIENTLIGSGFTIIELPSIELASLYENKLGDGTGRQVYNIEDKRDVVLRPEGTATVSAWYDEKMNGKKDVKVFYVEKMYRKEKPQKGRYREFYQIGVEWLNPSDMEKAKKELDLLLRLILSMEFGGISGFDYKSDVKRGLDYYKGGGFEVEYQGLGSQKQVAGGGEYSNGVGFALGLDRLLLTLDD